MNNEFAHLGGHNNKTHTDMGTLSFLVQRLGIRSVLDIGCGPGWMYEVAKNLGVSWRGIDGDPEIICSDIPIIRHDFTLGPLELNTPYGLAWSVEFLEHVEERYMSNYMAAFTTAKYAVVTAAPPGYPGHHHVNCRLEDYWVGAFAANGFTYDHKMSQEIRKISTMQKPFMQRTGMFFKSSRMGV